MYIDLKAAAEMSAAETEQLRALTAVVYPPAPDAEPAPAPRQWAAPQWHFLLRNNERDLVSHVGVLTRQVFCDDSQMLIGGIGGVQTHPEWRGKGYAGAGLRRALEFLQRDLALDLSLLFCGPHMRAYYQGFGFQLFAGATYVWQDGAKYLFPPGEVMLRSAGQAWSRCAQLDLRGLPW